MKVILFFALTFGQLFSYDAVIQRVDQVVSPACAKKIKLGATHKGRSIYGYYVTPHKTVLEDKEEERTWPVVYINGSVHGNEKMGAVVSINLLNNLCTYRSDMKRSAFVIPILNPDGFSAKRGCRRGNAKCKDVNRDAWKWKTPEGRAWLKGFQRFKPVAYLDLHMTGTILILPKRKTRGYRASRKLSYFLRINGMRWYTRVGRPKGMLADYASSLGVPSVIVEIGRRGDNGYAPGHKQYRLTHTVTRALFRLFTTNRLPLAKG